MRLLTLVFLLVACRGERLMAVSECGRPCFPGDMEIGTTGACRLGVTQCDDDGNKTCVGAVMPKVEECNGLDDNCDGRVDEYIPDNPKLCENSCGRGFSVCTAGRWSECSAPKPQPETCNGKDDNCDGRVDEAGGLHLPDGGSDLSCYTGPSAVSASTGICHGGTLRCVVGRFVCYGEQLPTAEVCNGLDDDCDGQADEGAQPTDFLDLVVVFDNSGSMSGVATNLKMAANNWAAGGSTSRRYALVVAPDKDSLITYPRIYQDFTDAVGFATAMDDQNGSTGIGAEPTMDAIEQILNDQFDHKLPNRNGTRGLSWRQGSKRVIVMFSDEYPQSYFYGGTYGGGNCYGACPGAVQDIRNRLALGGVVLQVFTTNNPADTWTEWKVLSSAGGGQNWDITASIMDLEASLDEMLKRATCR